MLGNIQIWCVQGGEERLSMVIVHEFGDVLDLEWCPGGWEGLDVVNKKFIFFQGIEFW